MTNLTITQQGDQLVVDTRLIADRLGIGHKPLMNTIDKYLTELQAFGQLVFENTTVTNSVGAKNTVKFAYLNEAQATLLMSMSRNTPQVVACKVALVEAFEKAKAIIKEVIPAQSDRILELQLVNENLKMQLQWTSIQDNRIALHGLPVALMLEGKSDAVVEVEKTTIEVIDNRSNSTYQGQTLVQVKEYLENKFGIKFKSGADLKRQIEKLGRSDLIAQTPRSIIADYVPKENLEELCRVITGGGNRQMLVGES